MGDWVANRVMAAPAVAPMRTRKVLRIIRGPFAVGCRPPRVWIDERPVLTELDNSTGGPASPTGSFERLRLAERRAQVIRHGPPPANYGAILKHFQANICRDLGPGGRRPPGKRRQPVKRKRGGLWGRPAKSSSGQETVREPKLQFGTAPFGLGGKDASVRAPRRSSKAALSALSSLVSGGT